MAERFILELKLQTNAKDERELDRRFFMASKVKNILVSHGNKCLNRLRGNHHYHDFRQRYHGLHTQRPEWLIDKPHVLYIILRIRAEK